MQKEAIDNPVHYQSADPGVYHILIALDVPQSLLDCECILAIESMSAGFHVGSAIKYLWRYKAKNNPQEDLKKALWYLERLKSLEGMDFVGEIDYAIAEVKTLLSQLDR